MVCDVIDNTIAFWGKVYGLIQTAFGDDRVTNKT